MSISGEAWLEQTQESAIDPDLAICDPHHHLWYQAENQYGLEEFLKDASGGHHIVQTVFVESWKTFRQSRPSEMLPVDETEYIENIVSHSSQSGNVAAGIVGFADLTSGAAVLPLLEAHIEAGRGRFRGVRQTCTWDASPEIKSTRRGLLSVPEFRQGFACLQKYGLSFDAWLYHPQLTELADLAGEFPETSIIIDHIGGLLGIGPYFGRRDTVFQEWKCGIASLAAYQNVFVKLGGLGMPICGFGWQEWPVPPTSVELADAMKPYFYWCIEQFGVSRCMFESNFPVDKTSYSYTVLWNAFKRVIKDFSPSEKNALLHETAAKVYRLSPHKTNPTS
jgi:L-fuconolactonase